MDSRLRTIMDFVPIGSRVADIGTDHGYLAIELIKSKIAISVIASDKNAGPLEAARKNIKAAEVEGDIDLRLGDGLQSINTGEVNVICIAGMGGALICEILTASPEVTAQVDKIILQPMNAVEKVRQWVESNDWNIEDEDLAEVDGIIYEILCISHSLQVNSTKKMNSPLLPKFIQSKIDKLKRILEAMNQSTRARTSDKYFEIQEQIRKLEIQLESIINHKKENL